MIGVNSNCGGANINPHFVLSSSYWEGFVILISLFFFAEYFPFVNEVDTPVFFFIKIFLTKISFYYYFIQWKLTCIMNAK